MTKLRPGRRSPQCEAALDDDQYSVVELSHQPWPYHTLYGIRQRDSRKSRHKMVKTLHTFVKITKITATKDQFIQLLICYFNSRKRHLPLPRGTSDCPCLHFCQLQSLFVLQILYVTLRYANTTATARQVAYSRNKNAHRFGRLLPDVPDFKLANRVDGRDLRLREKWDAIQRTTISTFCNTPVQLYDLDVW